MEVDSAFDTNSRRVEWDCHGRSVEGSRFVTSVAERDITQHFTVTCKVIVKREWHRLPTGADDLLIVIFKVLRR